MRASSSGAALGFIIILPSYDRALWALRMWLDSWSGIGLVTVGMYRQGSDLQLTQHDGRGWQATFYATGMEDSPTSATGTAWERTPWHATQRAACGPSIGRIAKARRLFSATWLLGGHAGSRTVRPQPRGSGRLICHVPAGSASSSAALPPAPPAPGVVLRMEPSRNRRDARERSR
jgi:hypothetical protein